jgi:hypothetical protein
MRFSSAFPSKYLRAKHFKGAKLEAVESSLNEWLAENHLVLSVSDYAQVGFGYQLQWLVTVHYVGDDYDQDNIRAFPLAS